MSPLRRICVGLLLVGLCASACTQKAQRIDMTRVPPPPGGIIETVSVLGSGDDTRVVAPSRRQMYVQRPSGGRWERRAVEWPTRPEGGSNSPLAGMTRSRDTVNFPARQRFTTHRERIWLLTHRRSATRPVLLVSHDVGRSWTRAPLPALYETDDQEPDDGQAAPNTQLAGTNAKAPLRLISRGNSGLYLLDEDHVWRAVFSEKAPVTLDRWKPIDISEIDVLDSATPTTFPSVVRNFLPATEKRPFEILTVFGDRLYVYRRHRASQRWILVSTLPTIDLSIHSLPGRDLLYLFGPEAIYRSAKQGEQWEKLTLTQPLADSPKHRSLGFIRRPKEGTERPLPTIVVGTEAGAIYRSIDGGDRWELSREPDPDGRAVTGFAYEPEAARLWAATEGLGVLRSSDGGATWRASKNGMRATQPLAVATGPNDELLLGTHAGLFRLTGAPEDGHWDRYHDRATTSVEVNPRKSRIFAGTLGGAIVTEAPGGELNVSEAGTIKEDRAPLFQPWRVPSALSESSAILSVESRPSSERMFAWSRGQGILHSTDNGVSWRRMQLNSAVLSALERSVVTNFVVDHGERMYLTSHPFDLNSPAQLWRSYDDGETWHAVYTFPGTRSHDPLILNRGDRHATEKLFLTHGNRFARSLDAGSGWTDLHGPWETATIRAFEVDEDRLTLAFNSNHATEIAFVREERGDTPPTRTYSIVWPDKQELPPTDIRDVASIDRFVYLTTDDELYAGTVPAGESQLPHAPTIIATMTLILIMTGLSFWYLRNQNSGV